MAFRVPKRKKKLANLDDTDSSVGQKVHLYVIRIAEGTYLVLFGGSWFLEIT